MSFLRTGGIGPLHPGAPALSVPTVLGAPIALHTPADIFWDYGDLEISTCGGPIVELISLYFWRSARPSLPNGAARFLNPIPRERTLRAFLRLLERNSLPWRTIELLTFDDQIGLMLQSGVTVVFGSGRIYGVFSGVGDKHTAHKLPQGTFAFLPPSGATRKTLKEKSKGKAVVQTLDRVRDARASGENATQPSNENSGKDDF